MAEFIDYSNIPDLMKISNLKLGMSSNTIAGEIIETGKFIDIPHRNMLIYSFVIQDDTGAINVTIFGPDARIVQSKIEVGKTYILSKFNVKNKFKYDRTNHKYEVIYQQNFTSIELAPTITKNIEVASTSTDIIKLGEHFAKTKPGDVEEASGGGPSTNSTNACTVKEIPHFIGAFINVKTLPHPKLLIRDLLKAETISLSKNLVIFERFDIKFERAMCLGTVIVVNSETNSRHTVTLDDGTGTIPIYSGEEVEEKHEKLKEVIYKKHAEYLKIPRETFKEKPEIAVASKLIRFASNALDSAPSLKSLKIGDDLIVVGRITQYGNRRYMWAKEFRVPDVQAKLDYLQDLLGFYKAAGVEPTGVQTADVDK